MAFSEMDYLLGNNAIRLLGEVSESKMKGVYFKI